MRTIEIVLKVFSRDAKGGGSAFQDAGSERLKSQGSMESTFPWKIIPLCEQRVHVVPYCSGIDGVNGA